MIKIAQNAWRNLPIPGLAVVTAYDPAKTPKTRFDVYLIEAECQPEFRARRERIAGLKARHPPHPFWNRLLALMSAVMVAALWGSVAVCALAWLPGSG